MRVKEVIVLEDAAIDLDEGVAFYNAQEQGVGHYFYDSLLSDIGSLQLHAGIHSVRFGYHRMLAPPFSLRDLLRCRG